MGRRTARQRSPATAAPGEVRCRRARRSRRGLLRSGPSAGRWPGCAPSCRRGTGGRAGRNSCAASYARRRRRYGRNWRIGNSRRHRAAFSSRFRGSAPSTCRAWWCPSPCRACAGSARPPHASGGAAWRWFRANGRRNKSGSAVRRRRCDRPPTACRTAGGPCGSGRCYASREGSSSACRARPDRSGHRPERWRRSIRRYGYDKNGWCGCRRWRRRFRWPMGRRSIPGRCRLHPPRPGSEAFSQPCGSASFAKARPSFAVESTKLTNSLQTSVNAFHSTALRVHTHSF